jgi:predicted metal-dependent hydrolase
MTQMEIKTVELVRQIRDQHYALLKDKSREDIKRFFHQEAAASNAEAEQLLQHERSPTASRP